MTTMKPRERRSSAPSSPQRSVSSNGQRSPRPNTPVNKQTIATDKPTTLNYLKPKSATPTTNPPKPTKTIQSPTPTTTTTSKRVSVPKPSASVAPERRRSLTSPSPPRNTTGPIRLPTAAPRQFNTLKPSLDKIPKVNFEKVPKVIPKGTKTGLVTRTKSLEKRPSEAMPQNQEPQQQENGFLVTEIVPKLEDKHIIDDVTVPIEAHVEEVIADDQKEVIGTTTEVVAANEGDDVVEIYEAKEIVSGPKGVQKVQDDEVKTLKVIKCPPRGPVAVKKEAVRNNDVIEDAKSKFLEKRKNKVLALVGAFETVMALQEPEGQQQPKEKDVGETMMVMTE